VALVVAEDEANRLFERLNQEDISVFYMKSAAEFRTVGEAANA